MNFLTDTEVDDDDPTMVRKRMPSRVKLTICPTCKAEIHGWNWQCEACDSTGFIDLPRDRDSLDRLYFKTGRGSLERIAVMAQRQRCGFPVRPRERRTD